MRNQRRRLRDLLSIAATKGSGCGKDKALIGRDVAPSPDCTSNHNNNIQ